jgi:hypothetical protein
MTSRMLFELLGFLLSTNVKVKNITTVSAVMFECHGRIIVNKNIQFLNNVIVNKNIQFLK